MLKENSQVGKYDEINTTSIMLNNFYEISNQLQKY